MLSYQILDMILHIMKTTTEDRPLTFDEVLNNLPEDIRLSNRDRSVIRKKLKDDKYIDTVIPVVNSGLGQIEHEFITFEGLMLLEMEGGYTGKIRSEQFLAAHQLKLTRLITVGTVGAALFACLQLMLNIVDDNSKVQKANLSPIKSDTTFLPPRKLPATVQPYVPHY